MSADIITLPLIPRPQAIGDVDEIALPPLRLPRSKYGRLMQFARDWDVDIGTAAEMVIVGVMNEMEKT